MKFKGVKLSALLLAAVFLLFFSNDFGLIDIEKTAIITAVAIDLEESIRQAEVDMKHLEGEEL